MVEKAEITDIAKLRPELMEMSVKELERRRTEIEMAIEKISEKEKIEARAKLVEEANAHFDQILESLRFLEENKLLPDSLVQFFTTEKGAFVPHLRLKKLKS